jgi:hypothetical protein
VCNSTPENMLDRETVVQAFLEIAQSGPYAPDAVSILFDELTQCGYTPSEVQTIVSVCKQVTGAGDASAMCDALCTLLANRDSTRRFLADGTLDVACLLLA